MMFNNIITKLQNNLNFLYQNSLFLKNIDNFILFSILLVFVTSAFLSSDCIGFIALITIFLTFIKLITKQNEKISLNNFEIFLLIYFMIVIISLAGSTLFALSLKGFLKTFIYIGFYFSVAQYLKNNLRKFPLIALTIALCVGFESIIAILQNFAHVEEISTWQDVSNLNPEEIMTRVYGTLKPFNPNLLGGYFVAGIPSLISVCAYYFYKNYFKVGMLFALITGLSCIALFLTGCRGSYLALLLIIALTFLLSAKFFWQKYKQIYLLLIGSAVGLFTFALCFITSLRARFFSIFAMRNDSSNSFRFNVYNSSIQMFKDNWLLGIGVGNKNFREIYGLYMKTGFDALSTYNVFLEIAVESGIFALISFLIFLVLYVKEGLRIIFQSKNSEFIIFTSMAVISVISVMMHGFVDTIFFRPQLQFIFWTNIALISACKYNLEKDFT